MKNRLEKFYEKIKNISLEKRKKKHNRKTETGLIFETLLTFET